MLVTTNICGSDLHIYNSRFAARSGMLMGHEDAGEVVEVGSHVEYIKKGDICSVPFNVACGTCTNCKQRHTDVCLRANSWIGNETRDSLRWPFQYARGAIGTIPLQS